MVSFRPALLAVLLLGALLPAVSAQDASYVYLGDDATGDPSLNGVPMIDTWIDINGLAVETVGDDLVFHLGLEGTTTEAGSYCWMAAFEFAGTEYVGLDCYEGLAYESDNTLSTVSAPSTSRGTNVASEVVFEDGGARITVPLASIGAAYGDVIEDIYGLTYATRVLTVVDTVPDAKSSVGADESLGSYIIGGAPPPMPMLANDTVVTGVINGSLDLEFDAPSNETHTYTWNATGGDVVLNATWNTTQGAFDARLLDPAGVELLNQTLNGTAAFSQELGNVTVGNWTLELAFHGFVGHVSASFLAAPAPVMNETADEPVLTIEDQESPGFGLVAGLAALGLAYRRKRRT